MGNVISTTSRMDHGSYQHYVSDEREITRFIQTVETS